MRKYMPSAYMVDVDTDEPVFTRLCEYVRADDPLIAGAQDLLRDLRAARDDLAAMASDSNGWREWDATAVDQLLSHRLVRLNGALRRAEGSE